MIIKGLTGTKTGRQGSLGNGSLGVFLPVGIEVSQTQPGDIGKESAHVRQRLRDVGTIGLAEHRKTVQGKIPVQIGQVFFHFNANGFNDFVEVTHPICSLK